MSLISTRGDTLIEVLLAVTVFSLVAIGTIGVMNQGTNAAQRALEITLVREQIDAQAEALRAAHQAYLADRTSTLWPHVVAEADNSASIDVCPRNETELNGAFVMNTSTADVIDSNWFGSISDIANAPPYSKIEGGKAYGLWVEKRHIAGTIQTPGRYDFRVRACWFGAGTGSTPMKVETLVRLYDPA